MRKGVSWIVASDPLYLFNKFLGHEAQAASDHNLMNTKKAVVLLSGGLDSTTILYYAKSKGFTPYCLTFEYGQRHSKEIDQAKKIAGQARCRYRLMKIALPWQGSSLLDKTIRLPLNGNINRGTRRSWFVPRGIKKSGYRATSHKLRTTIKIPSTYVPARNIIFLSFSVSYAEAIGAKAVFIGANAIDYSGYPDCRPEFFKAYQSMLALGLKAGVEGKTIKIHTPLIRKTKAQIIKMGMKLGVPYGLTWSCYQGRKKPCGKCDSCHLRQKGFETLNIKDPI